MRKQVMIIIGAVVVIALVSLFAYSRVSKSPSSVADVVKEGAQSVESMTKGSIKSLLSGGKNVSCTINYPDGQGRGTVYVSGQKMRGDFMMMADGKEMESHMIQDGDTGYFWSGTQGTKMKIDKEANASPVASAQNAQGADLDKEVDLKCSAWMQDSSKFEVPSNVQFTDVSAMIQKMQAPASAAPGGPGSSICDAITEP